MISYENFMIVNENKRLYKLFPKDLICYDIKYNEYETFMANKFNEKECEDGIHFTDDINLLFWLCKRSNMYYICEITPNEHSLYVVYKNKIKTNICNIGKLHKIDDFFNTEFILSLDYINCINDLIYVACKNGYFNVIKSLHKDIGLSKDKFMVSNNRSIKAACKFGHLNIIKYLHKIVGFTKEDFKSASDEMCFSSCEFGYIDIVKYLHIEIGFTKSEFQALKNRICVVSCYKNGNVEIIRYLHEEIGFTKEEFQSKDSAYIYACINGNFDIVKYLCSYIGIKEHVVPLIFEKACVYGHIDIVKYLHINFYIDNNFILSMINEARIYNHTDIIKYLCDMTITIEKDYQ